MANYNLTYNSGKLEYVDPAGNAVLCKSAIGTAENWTASHWQETTIAPVMNNKADKT